MIIKPEQLESRGVEVAEKTRAPFQMEEKKQAALARLQNS